MKIYKNIVGYLLFAVIFVFSIGQADAASFVVKDGTRDTVSRGGKPCLSFKGLLQSNTEYAYFGTTYNRI